MTSEIQTAICKQEVLKSNVPCENVKYLISDWEYDVCSINKNGYITEFEVKISRGDFKADSKKRKFKYYDCKSFILMPNRFYYVCPKDLISVDEIQDYAGLIYYENEALTVIKKAPLISNHKHEVNKFKDKILRLQTQRMYLGCSMLTFNNNKKLRK